MEQKKIDRINALAKKMKAEGLTPQETAEQAQLRQAYIAAYRNNMKVQLEMITVEKPKKDV